MKKQNFLDVADGEAAILELSDEADAFENSCVVDPMSTLGAPRLFEQAGAFIKTDCVAGHATACRHITDSESIRHKRMVHLDD